MELLILLTVVGLYSTSLLLTYNDEVRRSNWYILISLGISILIGLLWACGVRYIDNKQKIFLFSLCWEFAVLLVDYIVPLVFYSLNVNKYVVIGSFVVAVGLTMMKVNMK